MRVRLRSVIIIVFFVFIAVIIIRVTDGIKYVLKLFEIGGLYIVLLTLLLLIGFLVFIVFFNRKAESESDVEVRCWIYLQDWWSDKMGMTEPLKLQDGFMKRGYYDSGQGLTELFIGFNITKKGTNQRIIFVIGTKPMSIAHFDNSPAIDEHQDPFLNFYSIPPTPVPHFDDAAVKAKFAGVKRVFSGGSSFKKKKKTKDEDSEEKVIEE